MDHVTGNSAESWEKPSKRIKCGIEQWSTFDYKLQPNGEPQHKIMYTELECYRRYQTVHIKGNSVESGEKAEMTD